MNLTFKQYIEGREQLLQAIKNTPIVNEKYVIRKYCSLSLGEVEDLKETVNLKPNNYVIVEWCYDNIQTPTPLSIKIHGVNSIDSTDKLSTFWTGAKLKKWLIRHTNQETL